jgi:hypothetical protein
VTDLRHHLDDHTTSVRRVRSVWDRLDAVWGDSAAGRFERQHERALLDEAAQFGRALDAVAQAITAIERDLL